MKSSKLPFSAAEYTDRRKTLMSNMESGKILLLGNCNASINFEDNYYNFRQDSNFLYYIGINEPNLNAIIDVDKGETILFGDDISIDHIIWMGNQAKLSDQASLAGIERVLSTTSIFDYVDKECHYLPPYRSVHTIQLENYLEIPEIKPSLKLILSIISQRNTKSENEISLLHKATSLTAGMHAEVIKNAKPGMTEYELIGHANKYAWDNNATWSFTPILTRDGQILHNHNYHNKLADGDLILFDGGIEHSSGYAGDMTRTFPINSKYSDIQKSLYNIVKAAHDVARDASKPKTYYKDVHLMAAFEIAKGMTELGFMNGDPEEIVDEGAHAIFFPHGLGHMIGLDVHDMENLGETFVGYDQTIRKSDDFGLKSLRLARPLEAGFAITIEPGIYIIPHLIDLWKSENKHAEFINYEELDKIKNFGGIRIENDYIIREGGAELLGDPLVYDIEGIEKLKSS